MHDHAQAFVASPMKPNCFKFLFSYVFLFMAVISGHGQSRITWKSWAELPALPEGAQEGKQPDHLGLAGTYSGVSNGILIVAGGANFPNKSPWKGGQKWYWDQIYLARVNKEGQPEWLDTRKKLSVPMAYGAVIQRGDEVLLIGGENSEGVVSDVTVLRWNSDAQDLERKSWSSLPEGFQAIGGGIAEGRILVHGVRGNRNVLLLYEGERKDSWKELEGCPGPPREYPVCQVQSNGRIQGFYLFSGRTTDDSGNIHLLTDGYVYDPIQNEWRMIGPVSPDGSEPICVMGASSISSGASHILVFGGDPGRDLLERVAVDGQWKQAVNETEKAQLKAHLDRLFEEHPGFSRQILSYHTITDSWVVLDTFPSLLPVTTQALRWENDFYITSGEIHPGVRTPVVWQGRFTDTATPFGWLNYVVIGLYFLGMILIGVKYSRRQKSTEDYFRGGGRVPWWAAGLSLFGTSLSAITFMAIPAKTYMTDWSYFFFQMTPLLVAPILIALYVPYFRRMNITSAYEFLEQRFNLLTRILGSLSFMLFQLGRVGIVLFLPSIAVSLVTGISIDLCIMAMGLVSIVYTMLGGIEAVIWTDVLQVMVLMGGALVCLILLLTQVDMNLGAAYHTVAEADKFRILDTAFDFTRPTIWVVLLGGVFANLITSGSDQTMVQRYLTTSDAGEAQRSVWTFAILAIPATLIFFTIGTALYLFYDVHSADLNPSITNDDAIFPWYIVSELPNGLSGLLIAGIFSAAMSSLSSSMNSVSTAFVTDFYQRFGWGSAESGLRVARIATLVFGVVGTGFALLMATWNIQSLWDQFQLYIGLFAGGLGGLFLLGMTSRRANGRGAVAGLILSGIVQYFLTLYTDMHVLMYAATGFVSCYVLSYLISLLPGFRRV